MNNQAIKFANCINKHELKGARTIAILPLGYIYINYELISLVNSFFNDPTVEDITRLDPKDHYINLACMLCIHALQDSGLPDLKKILIINLPLNNIKKEAYYLVHCYQFPIQNTNVLKEALQASCTFLQQLIKMPTDCWREALTKWCRQICVRLLSKICADQSFKNFGLSTLPLVHYANAENIPISYKHCGFIQYGHGKNSIILLRTSTDKDSAHGAMIAKDKKLTGLWLKSNNFPSPDQTVAYDLPTASEAIKRLGGNVVIKPNDGDRGEGISTDITSPKQIENAFKEALKYSSNKEVLIEELLPGATYRILIANNQFIFCIKRIPNGVIGDGTHSIEELVMQKTKK